MTWQQGYNPFGNMILSTLIAAIPVVVFNEYLQSGKVSIVK